MEIVSVNDQIKMKSLGWALTKYDRDLLKRKNLDTEADMHTETTPCEDEGRYQGDAFTSQGTPKIVSRLLESRRRA